ncbi:hypothetical protein [Planctomycetes bacterium K23_9]|uniref:Glycosyltransferase RgtA/B/C/D-like domain-containing protein n=1 Tax=Stieleria marina TaxID=1930275 RepID=A0A517NSV1_9BACT|nr:hypothetical protein K239x_21630 [Planctomycetes bacterium K23_9]
MRKHEDKRENRRTFYHLCLLVVMCLTAGRICSVTSREGDTAFLSANDRSRWCTVASLVEDGTYEIDRFVNYKNKKNRRPWYTIDMVRHRGADGEQHFYSSKPPLFPTMVAGVYWVAHNVFGLTMSEQPIYVPRLILLLVNLPLLYLFCWSSIWSIEMVGRGDWSRRFAATCVCFGTMLTAFAISLNNHLPAAAFTGLMIYLYFKAAEKLDDTDAFHLRDMPFDFWMLGGVAAAFTAANELPALCMLVLWGGLVYRLSQKAIVPFALGALLVAAAFFGSNYAAHSTFRPAYAHRGNGAEIGSVELLKVWPTEQIQQTLTEKGLIQPGTSIDIRPSGEANRAIIETDSHQLFALISDLKSNTSTIHHWDDWYDYPGSYWNDGNRKGVDLGEPSRLLYLVNMTFGYYGIFSISPIWLLAPLGLIDGLNRGPRDYRRFVAATGIATIVCMLFYVLRPEIDRNYGGVSACFRWMLWFSPLWLTAMAPIMDDAAEYIKQRFLLLALLGCSVFSVSFALDSPWQSPWIYQFWSFLGWIG